VEQCVHVLLAKGSFIGSITSIKHFGVSNCIRIVLQEGSGVSSLKDE